MPAPSGSQKVDAHLANIDGETRAILSLLRALALGAHAGVGEHIKWNAPSFCVGGDDRITLGLERKGGVRAVLHRGAKVKDSSGFRFADDSGLVRWATPDRGILTFQTAEEVSANRPLLADLFARWLATA